MDNTFQGQYLSRTVHLKGRTFQGQYLSRRLVFKGNTLHGQHLSRTGLLKDITSKGQYPPGSVPSTLSNNATLSSLIQSVVPQKTHKHISAVNDANMQLSGAICY
jgi:hypothetical protein